MKKILYNVATAYLFPTHVQWWHTGSLESATMGAFILWKLTAASNQGLGFWRVFGELTIEYLLAHYCQTSPAPRLLDIISMECPGNLPLSLMWVLHKSVKFKWTCPELMAMQMIVYGHASGLCPIERKPSHMWKVWDPFASLFHYS